MFKNKYLSYVVILSLLISSTGCAALQRKFTRKKQKEKEVTSPVIISTYDYSKDMRVEELYKKYFLFWKSWQTELIERMDATYKKRIDCYDRTLESLIEMEKYLNDSKREELGKFITELKSLDPDIRDRRLTKSEVFRMKQLLERTKRQIDREFSYSKVKDFLQF